MGTPFKMKGSAFYGKGNQSPALQVGSTPSTTPPPGHRAERQAPSAPAAPSAASLDYVNPVEGTSPASQRLAKNNSQAATNKAEMQAVRTAQGGPVEGGPLEPTPYTPSNPGSTGTSSGGPGGGPGPMAQVNTKTKVTDVDAMTKNKIEAYQAKAAQGGPIEQKKQPKTYSGQTTSLKSHKNKMQRLTGKTVTYKDAWQGMPAHKRKSKFGDDYNKFVGDAEKFNKENKSYKKGTVKYQRYQGTY